MENTLSKKLIYLLFFLFLISHTGICQHIAQYVDPFIGTGRSTAKTKWGNYGGTYPGAVSPWGCVQLTPETSIRPGERGYYYEDNEIRAFSCANHNSGFPNGSSGVIHLLFIRGSLSGMTSSARPFSHTNEEASPGFYQVKFDEGDKVEATTTTRTGLFRYTPTSEKYIIGICRAGEIKTYKNKILHLSYYNGLVEFNTPWEQMTQKGDTLYFEFTTKKKNNSLLIKVGVSSVDVKGSENNIRKENPGWDFDTIKQKAFAAWDKELQVIEIPNASEKEKIKFYTALYHSFLIPHIVSDADGRYTGADGNIHQSLGENMYMGFSCWDTFRTLHPLLTLLKPHIQKDMILSLQQFHEQAGKFPSQPMTGFHIIPMVLDSYVKGIDGFDTAKMYQAMKKCLPEDKEDDPVLKDYREKGFVPDIHEKSVSITLEYAYNDWAISQFAFLTGQQEDSKQYAQYAVNYRNLLDVETLFMLPRNENGFIKNPGEMGYQESDKYTTSFFAPHNIQDLINLMGGKTNFVNHLEECYTNGFIIHDNEPVLHYPYLFTYAGRPDLTAGIVKDILHHNYNETPGGIPGNDDLGSMSSWYVFSSIGLFPVCPGSPEYILTPPLYDQILIHQPGNKVFTIYSDKKFNDNNYSFLLNETHYKKLYLEHKAISSGGELAFKKTESKTNWEDYQTPYSLKKGEPMFHLSDLKINQTETIANQNNTLNFTLSNQGSAGTKDIHIWKDGKIIAGKRILLEENETKKDSILFKLYEEGSNCISVGEQSYTIHVNDLPNGSPRIICRSISSQPVVKTGENCNIKIQYQNISGKQVREPISVYVGEEIIYQKEYTLAPGEIIDSEFSVSLNGIGIQEIQSLDKTQLVKIYQHPIESTVLSLGFNQTPDSLVLDDSGFNNHGLTAGPVKWNKEQEGYSIRTGQAAYISLPTSESLMKTGNTITLSIWMKPTERTRGYVDFFTKGDYTLLKMANPETLVFFAGGWGRGECSIKVPENWYGEWHHVTGVCSGDYIRLYIDGMLQEEVAVDGIIEETEVPWNIGRNAEMPYSRFFEGFIDDVTIYKEALSSEEIKQIYETTKKEN